MDILNYQRNRGTLIEVHLADLHFGAFDPKKQYQILVEQVLSDIAQLPKLDIISIDGDLFDHKVMSNSDAALYASKFVADLVHIAKQKNATLILLAGTYSHDFDQLKLFYHYMDNSNNYGVDVRVITNIQFEYIKGAKILMVPELMNLCTKNSLTNLVGMMQLLYMVHLKVQYMVILLLEVVDY